MNRSYAVLAASACALGTVVFAVPEASAMLTTSGPTPSVNQSRSPDWPDEGAGYPGFGQQAPEYKYPAYKFDPPAVSSPPVKPAGVSASGNTIGAVQAGGSALGGAAVALAGVWLVRRRGALVR
ncbi:hypothetical protein [Kribbella sp. NPDC049584]|uniref:hypothetical protein n=1 Tax=Kribbella sp. NPDC049584 TaxID=3154833 RepID=UPI00342EC32B